jgi:signal peptidase I
LGAKRVAWLLVAGLLLVLILLRLFAYELCYVPSDSMAPTLEPGDRLLANTWRYRFHGPGREDIVVFDAPASVAPDGEVFVKRVVGLPGDEIGIWYGRLYLNGRVVPESYLKEPMHYVFPDLEQYYTVPEGQVFVLGDNRNESDDSHWWGALPEKNLRGRVERIVWPRERAKALR